jgi:hypothetical protein
MSKDLVQDISANVNVGMDEVVSVFVSRYETTLFNKKDELSGKIKVIKNELKDQQTRLEESVNKSHYEVTNDILNISSKVKNVRVDWEKSHINIEVNIKDNETEKGRYADGFSKTFKIKLEDVEVTTHKERQNEIESLNAELMEVMGLIKSVSRKERQIRGKISEMKLKESGLSTLLENDEMLKLVQLN